MDEHPDTFVCPAKAGDVRTAPACYSTKVASLFSVTLYPFFVALGKHFTYPLLVQRGIQKLWMLYVTIALKYCG